MKERAAFLLQSMRHPRQIGAIAPSSRALGNQMAREALRLGKRGLVVELGAGTGSITRALLAGGVAPARLHLFEMNADLAAHLRHRFPDVTVHAAPAQAMRGLLPGRAVAVVSGLPLLNMGADLQRQILSAAFACLQPGGALIQFTYGPKVPVERGVLADLGLRWRRLPRVWANLPPAQVYVLSRG